MFLRLAISLTSDWLSNLEGQSRRSSKYTPESR